MAGTSSSKCDADDLMNHVMKVFRDATKDCEDNKLKAAFAGVKNYRFLIVYAFHMYESFANDSLAKEAEELFKSFTESGIFSEVAVLTIVIRHYTITRNTKAALKVYQNMIASGVAPTSCTYTI